MAQASQRRRWSDRCELQTRRNSAVDYLKPRAVESHTQPGFVCAIDHLQTFPEPGESIDAIHGSRSCCREADNRAASVAALRVSCRSDGENNSRCRGKNPSL